MGFANNFGGASMTCAYKSYMGLTRAQDPALVPHRLQKCPPPPMVLQMVFEWTSIGYV